MFDAQNYMRKVISLWPARLNYVFIYLFIFFVTAAFKETDTFKWADSFCRIFRENPVNINHGK